MSESRLPPPLTLAELVERVRCLAASPFWTLSETSGGRSASRNKLVGGSDRSWHCWARGGLARDVVVEFDFDWAFRQSGADRGPMEVFLHSASNLGLDAVDEGDHVHLEPSGS